MRKNIQASGLGWEFVSFGKIAELGLKREGEKYDYIFIFSDEERGEKIATRLISFLEQRRLASQNEKNWQQFRNSVEEYLYNLDYQLNLNRENLETIIKGQTKNTVPPFYQQALQGNVVRIMQFR